MMKEFLIIHMISPIITLTANQIYLLVRLRKNLNLAH